MAEDATNPTHYSKYEIEPIDYMIGLFTEEEFRGYCRGSVIKYISRYRDKGGVEDLNKALRFLTWLIELERASEESKEMKL